MDLSTFLFAAALSVSAPTGQDKIARAYYKQSGMEKTVRRLEREHLSPKARMILANASILTNAVINQQIIFRWTFP